MKAPKAEAYSSKRLLLQDGVEIIGTLKAATSNELIVRCLKTDTRVSVPPDIIKKAAKLVGERIAILRIRNRFYIRKAKDGMSASETPDVNDIQPKELQHNLLGLCYGFGGYLRDRVSVSFGGCARGVSNG